MLKNIQTISELYKKGSHLEAQQMMMEWWEEALKYRENNIALKEEVGSLREQLEIKGKMIWEKPYYWLVDGDKREGPFCQVCWDKDSEKIRLQDDNEGNGMWQCQSCKNTFYDSSFERGEWP